MVERVWDILKREHTPLEKGLAMTCALLAGVIIGFLLSPVKKGIMLGSKNGCNNGSSNRNNSSSIHLPEKKRKQKR